MNVVKQIEHAVTPYAAGSDEIITDVRVGIEPHTIITGSLARLAVEDIPSNLIPTNSDHVPEHSLVEHVGGSGTARVLRSHLPGEHTKVTIFPKRTDRAA